MQEVRFCSKKNCVSLGIWALMDGREAEGMEQVLGEKTSGISITHSPSEGGLPFLYIIEERAERRMRMEGTKEGNTLIGKAATAAAVIAIHNNALRRKGEK